MIVALKIDKLINGIEFKTHCRFMQNSQKLKTDCQRWLEKENTVSIHNGTCSPINEWRNCGIFSQCNITELFKEWKDEIYNYWMGLEKYPSKWSNPEPERQTCIC